MAYQVSDDRRAALEAFGRGVRVVDDGEALAARSGDESLNLLALNLADEVARGARTPAEARVFYDQTAAQSLAGRTSPYMTRLLFPPR